MAPVNDGERLAALEVEMRNLQTGIDMANKSVDALHVKFDSLQGSYVSKGEFEEWKRSRWLERLLMILTTAVITTLVAYALGGKRF